MKLMMKPGLRVPTALVDRRGTACRDPRGNPHPQSIAAASPVEIKEFFVDDNRLRDRRFKPQAGSTARSLSPWTSPAASAMMARRGKVSRTSGSSHGGEDEIQHLHRCRRLDLRALARQFLSRGPGPEERARICEPPADLDRDQRHLLRLAEAGELRTLARGDAGGFRLLRQGQPIHHQPARARRGRVPRSSASSPAASWS